MTLHATLDELTTLVEHHIGACPAPPEWDASGVTIAWRVHPAIAQIVRVAALPRRVTAIERFDVAPAPVVHVGWDAGGRAVLTTIDGDTVAIVATRLELLPALLAQRLRLGPPAATSDRTLVLTTAAEIDTALEAIASGRPPEPHLGLLGSFAAAWRVTGGWSGRPVDRTCTVLDAGARGLWSVETLGTATSAATIEVVLRPVEHHDAIAMIGDVVTGRSERLRPTH